MQKFTAFCQEDTGRGTTWIGAIEAEDLESAAAAGIAACAADWGDEFPPERIRLLGIAAGDVTILEWNDLDD